MTFFGSSRIASENAEIAPSRSPLAKRVLPFSMAAVTGFASSAFDDCPKNSGTASGSTNVQVQNFMARPLRGWVTCAQYIPVEVPCLADNAWDGRRLPVSATE